MYSLMAVVDLMVVDSNSLGVAVCGLKVVEDSTVEDSNSAAAIECGL